MRKFNLLLPLFIMLIVLFVISFFIYKPKHQEKNLSKIPSTYYTDGVSGTGTVVITHDGKGGVGLKIQTIDSVDNMNPDLVGQAVLFWSRENTTQPEQYSALFDDFSKNKKIRFKGILHDSPPSCYSIENINHPEWQCVYSHFLDISAFEWVD